MYALRRTSHKRIGIIARLMLLMISNFQRQNACMTARF